MANQVLKVDFSTVEDKPYVNVGEHQARVATVEQKDGTEYPYLVWEFEILGKTADAGKKINFNTTLKPSGLFNLKNFLTACGYDIPKSAVNLDLDKVINKRVTIEVKMVKDRNDDSKEYANVVKVLPPKQDLSAFDVGTELPI